MSETIIGIFSNGEQAHQAIVALDRKGIGKDNVGFISGDRNFFNSVTDSSKRDVVSGIEAGAVAGGATGFLLGLTAFAIPLVGPIVAAGTLAATLAGGGLGAVAGGLMGVFTGHGVSDGNSHKAAFHVHSGGAIITAATDPEHAVLVRSIIEQCGGTTQVEDIPDAGTLPSDPLRFTSDTDYAPADEDPIGELGASRESLG